MNKEKKATKVKNCVEPHLTGYNFKQVPMGNKGRKANTIK